MSRNSGSIEQQGSPRLERLAVEAAELWSRFTQSRLYVQVLLSLLLVALSYAVVLVPGAYADRAQSGLNWLVTHDTDFAGKVSQVREWIQDHKGLPQAVSALRAGWSTRLGEWRKALVPPTAPAATTGNGPVMPVKGAVLYGYGWLPEDVRDDFHFGIDLVAPLQTAVVAVRDGVVVRTGFDPNLGQLIEIDHGDVVALYAQVSTVKAKAGTRVRRGEQIAVIAKASGVEKDEMPHLHFELRPAGRSEQIDPAHYLGLGGNKI